MENDQLVSSLDLDLKELLKNMIIMVIILMHIKWYL